MEKPNLMKRFAAVALAGASLFVATAAYAGEVTIWCWDPNFNVAIMKEAGARYTAKHPGTTFNVVDFAKTDVEQKLQTALSSGTTDALPDIVLIEDYGAQKYLQSFPGAFAAMSGKVDYSGFAPYKVQLMTMEDKVYGMPFDSGVTGLYYRKDYLEQAGFKPEDMHHLGPLHRDRQGCRSQDRPQDDGPRRQRCRLYPYPDAVGWRLVFRQ